MSDPERVGDSAFMKELNRLHAQRFGEKDTNVRAMLDKQIADLIREHANGRTTAGDSE